MAIAIIGSIGLATNLHVWRTGQGLQLAVYLLFSIVSSAWKVKMPGMKSTMSVAFLFALITLFELGISEALIVTCAATIIQVIWQAKTNIKLLRTCFNVATVAISVIVAHAVMSSSVFRTGRLEWTEQLFAGAITYFLVNSGLVALAISLAERKPVLAVWRECHFLSATYYLLGAAASVVFHLIAINYGWHLALGSVVVMFVAHYTYQLYMARLSAEQQRSEERRQFMEQEKLHAERLETLHLRTIYALASAVEAKDQATHKHLERVQVYALEMGKQLQLSEDEMKALHAASILHDIGKLAVPEHIISKPGKLTPEEFEKIKIHTVIGAEILTQAEFPYPVVPMVRSHHERWDGTGYPDGLAGEEIPIGARILSVVDCFDALTSDRQYRRAMSNQAALDVIRNQAGIAYDPALVKMLEHNCEKWRELLDAKSTEALVNTDVRVARGDAPAAGFTAVEPVMHTPDDYLSPIAAARQEAHLLFEMAQELGTTLGLKDTCSVLASRLRDLVRYDALAVFIKQGDRLLPKFALGRDCDVLQGLHCEMGEGLTGWAAANRRTIVNGDPSLDFVDVETQVCFEAALLVPLVGANGTIGVLALYREEKDSFSFDDSRVLQAFEFKIALTLENSLKYQKAQHDSMTDHLTELPNGRALFLRLSERIEEVRQSGDELTVLVCDLDGFKQLNDKYGHVQADQVLRRFGRAVRDVCAADDFPARMGGDEFAIITSRSDVSTLIQALQSAAAQAGRAVCGVDRLRISIGEANITDVESNPEDLLAAADRAMYECKYAQKRRPHLELVVSA
jgi:diguanylate cyclase (GGDEF)-like protein/putative nucleotidyltransferase with HDIG domain